MATNESDVSADFFDIDSLLAKSTKVDCTYASNTPREIYELLGTAAPHYTGDRGYKVLTPFWLVRALEPYCSLSLPLAYNTNMRNVLLSNAAHADLETIQPYYYELGMQLCHSLNDSLGLAVAECLLKTMVQRIGGIVLRTIRDNETPKKIENLEKKLFDEGMKCRNRLYNYFRAQQIRGRKRRLE